MLKSLTVLLGTILASMLLFQIAANAASEIHYWEVGDESLGPVLWCGVIAVGLLLGGSIVVWHQPRMAALVFAVSLPLLGAYELAFNRNYLSISLHESIAWMLTFGIVVLIVMAWTCHSLEEDAAVKRLSAWRGDDR